MATIVAFHAHPDDESIQTGGTLARAAADGHRVVLVFATRGELGERPGDLDDDAGQLGDRRAAESAASARILGVQRLEFLGYHDSGMDGDPTNDDPTCFWQADVEEAAQRLAALLIEEAADVLVTYDEHGGYGHPDHIQVHRVGHRAADLAGTANVFEATMDRDHFAELFARAAETGVTSASGREIEVPEVAGDEMFGSPRSIITTVVDVRDRLDQKRESMRAHASQITHDSFFLALDDDTFAVAFGTEWYIRTTPAPDDAAPTWIIP